MKIVGSIIVENKIVPFILDTELNSLSVNNWSWDRAVVLSAEQEKFYEEKIRELMIPQIIGDVIFGEFFCNSCGKWRKATSQEWSYGMCLSCSLDRDSDFSEHYD